MVSKTLVVSTLLTSVAFHWLVSWVLLLSVGTGAVLLHSLVLPVRNRPSVTLGASFRYFRSLIVFR